MPIEMLKPRIVEIPPMSSTALELFRTSLVWDAILPWARGSNADHIDEILPRYRRAGVNFVSLTVGIHEGIEPTMRHIAMVRADLDVRCERTVLASTPEDIQDARDSGKLAVGFNVQDAGPLEDSLEMISVYRAQVSEALLERLAGEYETPAGALLTMELRHGALYGVSSDNADMLMIPYKTLSFRVGSFSDTITEFDETRGQVDGFTKRSSGGSYFYRRDEVPV